MSTVATQPTYEERVKGFDWGSPRGARRRRGDRINIGWYCSDRICRLGRATKPALIWEDFAGDAPDVHLRRPARPLEHHRGFLSGLGVEPGRARLPVHGPRARALPRLPRHPEDGRRSRSRCSRPSATSRCAPASPTPGPRPSSPSASTSPRCARSATGCPRCKHIIVVDAAGAAAAAAARSPLALDRLPRVERVRGLPLHGRDALGAALHLGHHRPAQGRPARPLLADLAVPHHQVGARPAGRTTSTGATPTPAGSPAPRTASSAPGRTA